MFEKRPLNPIRQAVLENGIEEGYSALLQRVISRAESKSGNVFTLVIDGTHGADFHALLKGLIPEYKI